LIPLPWAPGSCPPCPGSITMRDTPKPNCRAIEKLPLEFLDGGPAMAANAVPVELLVSSEAGAKGTGKAARASAMVLIPRVDPTGRRRPHSLARAREGRNAAAGVSITVGVDVRTQSITTRYGS